MKHKIVMSSDFFKASNEGCCSPTRFFDHCQDCTHVKHCKLPEAKHGRAFLLHQKIEQAEKNIEQWRKLLKTEESKN